MSTSGGTRWLLHLDICDQIAEFGPINASIHKVDEHIAIGDIDRCMPFIWAL
jgi:succinyl-diaminopimelate desuccinylase